jgi:ribose transport system ATP-binding protein
LKTKGRYGYNQSKPCIDKDFIMSNVIEMMKVTKRFHNVVALNQVSFAVADGEIHGILGENGAGKSTLIKLLHGNYQPDSGSIAVNGRRIKIDNPWIASKLGIVRVPQELTLIPEFTVTENVFIGSEMKTGKLKLIDQQAQIEKTRMLLQKLKSRVDPQKKIKDLSVHERQMVQIVRALIHDFQVLILDESTAFLMKHEVDTLFELLWQLKLEGKSIIFISHRLKEILQITDRITFLRNGESVAVRETKGLHETQLIQYMIGKDPVSYPNTPDRFLGKTGPVLEVKNLTGKGFSNVSFSLYPGEILGVAGFPGSGKSELARAIFGLVLPYRGDIVVFGKKEIFTHPGEAIHKGLGFVPDDHLSLGLFPLMSIKTNIILPVLKKMVKFLKVDFKRETDLANRFKEKLKVKTASVEQNVMSLSSGNQKKVILARWLAAGARILILDEPTAGIDVHAQYELNLLIQSIAMDGVAVICISSELSELMRISNRILVMKDGKLVQGLATKDTSEEEVFRFMMGKAI